MDTAIFVGLGIFAVVCIVVGIRYIRLGSGELREMYKTMKAKEKREKDERQQ